MRLLARQQGRSLCRGVHQRGSTPLRHARCCPRCESYLSVGSRPLACHWRDAQLCLSCHVPCVIILLCGGALREGWSQYAGEPPPPVPIQAILQRELKPCPDAEAALPIRAVWHVPGSKASQHSSILILGGQGADQPDMLHVLPLEPSPDAEVVFCCASPLHTWWSSSARSSRVCLLRSHLKPYLLGLAR